MQPSTSAKVDLRLGVLVIMILVVLDIMVVASFWNQPVNVSNNSGISDRPSIATDANGQIHLVWSDTSVNYPGNSEILYRSSTDAGATWSPESPLNLSESANQSLMPMIATAGESRRVIAWSDSGETVARIWTGSEWATPVTLSSSITPTLRLSTAINGDGVAVVAWTEGYGSVMTYSGTPPARAGFYRRWDGTAWSPAQPLATRLVTMRGSLAYLATEQGELLRSDNAGETWGTPLSLPSGYRPPDDIKLDSMGTLHMAWTTATGIEVGSYNGRIFSPPATITSWDQLAPGVAPGQVEVGGYIPALAIAINSLDQLNLIWAAPSIIGTASGNYSPLGVNGLGGEMTFHVMSSLSLDGRTWTTPAMQAVPGGFPTIAGDVDSPVFFGSWRSPGQEPDVFAAVNQSPAPSYEQPFDSPARLFLKGVDVITGTVQLNSANALDWPLFGFRQYYGTLLRGQTGASSLILMDSCATRFNTLTGRAENLPGLCLPTGFRFSDGVVQGNSAFVLASSSGTISQTTVFSPNLLLMNLDTGSLTTIAGPAGVNDVSELDLYRGCTGWRCSLLAVDQAGQQVYAALAGKLYRYSIATNSWADLNQDASAVAVDSDGTIYARTGTSLFSSSNGGAFSERSNDFVGNVLYVDQAQRLHGISNGQSVYTFLPNSGTVISGTTSIAAVLEPGTAVTEDAAGNLYILHLGDASFEVADGALYRLNPATRELTTVEPAVPNEWDARGRGIALAADDRIWMVAGRSSVGRNRTFGGFFAYDLEPLRGEVVSPPIFSGSGSIQWETLTYSATVPTGSLLTVDILDEEGTLLRANVNSGESLAGLPAVPVRLRVNMQADSAGESPQLDSWNLTWLPLDVREVLVLPNSPTTIVAEDGAVQIAFPSGAVTEAVTLTYTEQVTPSRSLGSLRFAGRSFTIVARNAANEAVEEFTAPFTLTLNYSDAELLEAGVSESDLDLVFWDGSNWVSTNPVIDAANNQLSVTLDHLTEFALVGNTGIKIHLPLVVR